MLATETSCLPFRVKAVGETIEQLIERAQVAENEIGSVLSCSGVSSSWLLVVQMLADDVC
jgi:hypothetical protein